MEHAGASVQVFRVATERRPRLDIFLHEQMPWRSRSQLKDLIASGKVTINDRRAKASCRVRRGDAIWVEMPSPPMPELAFRPGSIPVLYLDDHILALNKPSGILTHPISGHQRDTLLNYVQATFGQDRGAPLTCHRLDRETSGTILFAFDQTVCQHLQRQFEGHSVRKSYLAVVRGRFPPDPWRIDIPIRGGSDLQDSIRGERLRESLTIARCLAAGDELSLVEAVPVTGRQNQIRIHLSAIGFPLAGDARFGLGPPPAPADHFLLHAERISFYHPSIKLAAEITAPLPPDFQAAIESQGLEPGR